MARAKPYSPAWNPSGVGGPGCQLYLPLHEGSGAPGDICGALPTSGTLVGAPTWGAGPLGPQLGGFSAANYARIDGALTWGTYPCAVAVLAATASAATYQCPFFLGHNTSFPRIEFQWNGGSAGQLEFYLTGDSGIGPTLSATIGATLYDGQPHIVQFTSLSASSHHLYFDGTIVATSSTTVSGPFTVTRASIGARSRGATDTPFGGSVIAAGAWFGSVPDPTALAADWPSGTFSAARRRRRLVSLYVPADSPAPAETTLNVTLGAVTLAATATVSPPSLATLAETLETVTLAATAVVSPPSTASLTVTLAAVTLDADATVGTVPSTGTLDVTLGAVTLASVVVVSPSGVVSDVPTWMDVSVEDLDDDARADVTDVYIEDL